MNKSDLKENMTIEEASDYWDEHDFGQFRDVQEVHNMTFRISRKKYVAVDYRLYKEIRRKARLLNITENQLINDWLKEKVAM